MIIEIKRAIKNIMHPLHFIQINVASTSYLKPKSIKTVNCYEPIINLV